MDAANHLPDPLPQQVRRVAARALATGALRPIPTTLHHVDDGGVRFVVRMLAGHNAKPQPGPAPVASAPHNPFLPYDPDLFVADLAPAHVCLLNKYPVVANHLLVVTRSYASQDELLDADDFAALAHCMAQVDGLAFYNGGRIAGASQHHKHLQVAPFPLDPEGADLPMEAVLGARAAAGRLVQAEALPFPHCLAWLPPDHPPDAAALAEHYRAMLRAVGVWDGGDTLPRPYNWLATRRWAMVVPRTAEKVGGMSVNALGFAGSLLVRDAAHLAWLRDFGPLAALDAVARAA
ncbi:MAG: DUF4922 domain-containing protein [Caldilinea sp.]|nr:phosphorylase [Caldilineaceae bacterium]MCO5208460.1 DUF4922 domain-containing protein [Caldilinea sp.]MCW5839774.1 hypothetical protein [Caldilinea sp.]